MRIAIVRETGDVSWEVVKRLNGASQRTVVVLCPGKAGWAGHLGNYAVLGTQDIVDFGNVR